MAPTRRSAVRFALVAPTVASLALFLGLAAVPGPRHAQADDRPAIAPSAAPSGSAVPPPATSATTQATKLPIFADDLPSEEKSEVPKPAEWKTATKIDFDRRKPKTCELLRIREWVRFSCSGPGAMASHISGPSEGWSARTDPPDASQPWGSAVHWLQFPVRRGERRVMELKTLVTGNYGDGLFMGGGTTLSVQWNDGEPPRLTSQ